MKLWSCHECGKEWKTEDHVEIHFHPCHPPPRRYLPRARRWTPEALEGTTLEEVWLGVFADYAGGYRPPTPERARAETGEHGRRKDGTGRRELNL